MRFRFPFLDSLLAQRTLAKPLVAAESCSSPPSRSQGEGQETLISVSHLPFTCLDKAVTIQATLGGGVGFGGDMSRLLQTDLCVQSYQRQQGCCHGLRTELTVSLLTRRGDSSRQSKEGILWCMTGGDAGREGKDPVKLLQGLMQEVQNLTSARREVQLL